VQNLRKALALHSRGHFPTENADSFDSILQMRTLVGAAVAIDRHPQS